jgi:lysophospholipase L1-like esterase
VSRRILIALLVVAGLSVACEQGSTAATRPSIPAGARYVALGSSFASGAGIPRESGPCRRSDHSYPNLVADAWDLVLVDETCAGATTADVLDGQIDSVTASTELVTITVGGNDISYSATADACAGSGSCSNTVDEEAVAALPGSLRDVIDAAQTRAPDATIVVVTYPRVVPAQTCAALSFTSNEADLVRGLGQSLEDALVSAAADEDVLVADPYRMDGHGPCASRAVRWVEGASAGRRTLPFHPNANGHRAMAFLVRRAIERA